MAKFNPKSPVAHLIHPDEIQQWAAMGIDPKMMGADYAELGPEPTPTLASRIQEAAPYGNADLYAPMVKPLEPEEPPLEYPFDNPVYWDDPEMNRIMSNGPMPPGEPPQDFQLPPMNLAQEHFDLPAMNLAPDHYELPPMRLSPQEQLFRLQESRQARPGRNPTR